MSEPVTREELVKTIRETVEETRERNRWNYDSFENKVTEGVVDALGKIADKLEGTEPPPTTLIPDGMELGYTDDPWRA